MSELDRAIAEELQRRRKEQHAAERETFLRSMFGLSTRGITPLNYVPETHRLLFNEAVDRASSRPDLWRNEFCIVEPPAGEPILVNTALGDSDAKRAGGNAVRTWKRYKRTHKPVRCLHIYDSGTDYDTVSVYVTPDGRPWATSYNGGWQMEHQFRRAVGALFA